MCVCVYIHVQKVLQHVEFSKICNIYLECFNTVFCFNELDSDVICTSKSNSILLIVSVNA